MRHSLQQRLIALFILMAYAITGTAMLPAAVTLAAGIDGSHAVLVSPSEHGMQVILHHRIDEFTPAVTDHRTSLARVLVTLCQASESGDHEFNAAQCDARPGVERDLLSRVLNPPVEVNLDATFQLALTAPNRASDTAGTRALGHSDPPRQSVRFMLATVRLLI